MTPVAEKNVKTKLRKIQKQYTTSPFEDTGALLREYESRHTDRRQFFRSTIEDFLNSCENFVLSYDKNLPHVLADKILSNEPIIFSLAGESASGKSTAMELFKQALSENDIQYTMICADDYYLDTTKEIEEAGGMDNLFKKGFSFDVPDRVDLDLILEHFKTLKSGQTVYSPSYDFVTHASTPNVQEKTASKFILHEGIFALNDKFINCSDIRIYCETPAEIIKKRWYDRVASRGTSKESWDGQFKNIKHAAEKYIHPTKQNANLVISGNCSAQQMDELFNSIIFRLKLMLEVFVFNQSSRM